MSSALRIGVALAYWPWVEFEEQVRLARLADELGLDSVWTAEAWGQDAVSMLGYLAAVTERVALGSGLMQMPARKPTATAMAAASIDRISGGRFRLGLGLSGPQVSEGWYGVPYGRPLARTREYVATVRRVLAHEPVQLALDGDGQGALGLGKPLTLLAQPVQERIPIYLGAIGPRAIELAGEIADGWMPFMLDPDRPEVLLDPLRRGAQRAGREIAQIDVSPAVPVAIDPDIDRARDLVRPLMSFYLGGMGAREKNFYVELAEQYGHGAVAREVQERFLAGDRRGAAAALSDELLDRIAIATTPTGLDGQLESYARSGISALIALPFGDRERTLRLLAAAVASQV
jgi:F420-dependent oxidoreductase-like protein